MGRAFVGTSGYQYKNWRGPFYPEDLPARRWLGYASRQFDSIELNGTFYSLKSPAVFARWVEESSGAFVFAVKGSRFVTHNKKLKDCEAALANFFASGVLALGEKTGPFLWQLPATYAFDAERVEGFLRLLPTGSGEAERLAGKHDARVLVPRVRADVDLPYRHAFEVRHPSYFAPAFYRLLARRGIALVVADSAGKFPSADIVTADFSYIRLHGSTELYASGYTDAEIDAWARRVESHLEAGRDAYVYFDNDARAHAPLDARRLTARLRP